MFIKTVFQCSENLWTRHFIWMIDRIYDNEIQGIPVAECMSQDFSITKVFYGSNLSLKSLYCIVRRLKFLLLVEKTIALAPSKEDNKTDFLYT